MLPQVIKNGKSLRKLRMLAGISQHAAAREVGCAQPYLCQVEKGRRALSLKFGERLERLLGLKSGRLTGRRVARGRPVLPQMIRWAKRQLGKIPVETVPSQVRPSAFARGKARLPQEDPFWPMAIHLGIESGDEVRLLEKLRAGDELFWRRLNSLVFDSWSEKRFLVGWANRGAELLDLRPASVGCTLRITDPQTGLGAGGDLSPAFVLAHGETAIAAFPQLSVWTGVQYRRPDLTLVVTRGSRRVTAIVEVEGRPFHSDAWRERLRDQELGVCVYHLDAARVGDPAAIQDILNWCESLVA